MEEPLVKKFEMPDTKAVMHSYRGPVESMIAVRLTIAEIRDLITDYHVGARENRQTAEQEKPNPAAKPGEPTSADQLVMGAIYMETRAQELMEELAKAGKAYLGKRETPEEGSGKGQES